MPKLNGPITNKQVKKDHSHLQYQCHSAKGPIVSALITLAAVAVASVSIGYMVYAYILKNPVKVDHGAEATTALIFSALVFGYAFWALIAPGLQVLGTCIHYRKNRSDLERDFDYINRPGPLGEKPLADLYFIPDYMRIGEEFVYIKGPAPALIPVGDVIWLYSCQTKKSKKNSKLIYQVHFVTKRGSNYYLNFDSYIDMHKCKAVLTRIPGLVDRDIIYDSDRYLRWYFNFQDFQGEMERLRQINYKSRTEIYPALVLVINRAFRSYPPVKETRHYVKGERDTLPYVLVGMKMERCDAETATHAPGKDNPSETEGASSCDRLAETERSHDESDATKPSSGTYYRISGYNVGVVKKGDLLFVYDNIREAGTCVVERVPEEDEEGDLIVRDFNADLFTSEFMVLSTQSEQNSVLPMNPVVFAIISTAGQWQGHPKIIAYLNLAMHLTGLYAPIFKRHTPGEEESESRRFSLITVSRNPDELPSGNQDEQPMLSLLTDLVDAGIPDADEHTDLRFARMDFNELLAYVKVHFYGVAVNPFGPSTANLPNDFLHTIISSPLAGKLAEREHYLDTLLTAHGCQCYIDPVVRETVNTETTDDADPTVYIKPSTNSNQSKTSQKEYAGSGKDPWTIEDSHLLQDMFETILSETIGFHFDFETVDKNDWEMASDSNRDEYGSEDTEDHGVSKVSEDGIGGETDRNENSSDDPASQDTQSYNDNPTFRENQKSKESSDSDSDDEDDDSFDDDDIPTYSEVN